jgi:Caspase domain
MRKRRLAKQSRHWSIPCALVASAVLLPAAPALSAELYGLTVGIDDYEGTVNDLDGAVNDAKDVAQALDRAGAREVVRLFNDDASKAAITVAWDKLLAKAKPGDTIVFSYAGHGGQEPAPPTRHDKKAIESFLLGHFEPSGPGTRERILDDEMFAWLEEADRRGVKVVFVADSCTRAAWSEARALLA